MITVKTMKQIATSRTIPSFRSTGSRLAAQSRAMDQGRVKIGIGQMRSRQFHRQWLNRLWQRHYSL